MHRIDDDAQGSRPLEVGERNLQSKHAVALESILCTDQLNRRPSRAPDREKENRALLALAQALADSPQTILQTLADTILEVFQCGSAGLSLLTTHDGGKRFYWPAIAGLWKPHIGGGTPRGFGPCGDVLDRNTPLLFTHFERLYTYFQPVTPPVEECLLVPFYAEGKAVGTIWAIAHDDRRKFDAEDRRLLVSLGRFASAAYQVVTYLDAIKQSAAIIDSSNDAIISKNLDGIITSWNAGAQRIFGFTPEEAIGQPINIIIPPELQDEKRQILNRLRRGESIEHYKTIRRNKSGSKLNVSLTISPVRDSQGRITGASKIARDITKHKQAEEAQFRLAAIVDSSDDAIISTNLAGVITSWNRGAKHIFGWTAEEAVGQLMTFIIPPELWDEETQILKRLQAGERIDHYETVRKTKMGERVSVSLAISPVRDLTGRIVGASKIARDITERKLAEARLKNARDELEGRVRERTAELLEKNEELVKQTEVVRDLSARLLQLQDEERRRLARELHDSIGQLLAAVSMNISKVAREKGKLSPVAEICVEESTNLVEQTLTEIRTISCLLHPPLLDEVGLESSLKWFVEGFAQRSDIDVSLDMPSGLDRLSSDLEIAIFRVVQECLTNIHRHSGSKKAAIHLVRKHGCVHLEVSDEGKGIPLEKQKALNSSAALGVGFRGMRERVRQLGGALQVHSDCNGTIVTITLPVQHAKAASATDDVA